MITDTWLYTLSKEDLKKVICQAESLLRYIQEREDTENATRSDRWWFPESADEVMPQPAKYLMMGVICPANPKGDKGALYAVKYLRYVARGIFEDKSLSELKQLCDAYKWEVVTNNAPFPQPKAEVKVVDVNVLQR
jgi:hypothetical protein